MLLSALPSTTTTTLPPPYLQPLHIAPPPFPQTDLSPVSTALQSTCRELQSLISSTHRSIRPSSSPPSLSPNIAGTLQSPIELRPKPFRFHRATNSHLGGKVGKCYATKPGGKVLRATNKVVKPKQVLSIPSSAAFERLGKENAAPTTPVGQLDLPPPVLPLGLGRGDFERLRGGGRDFEKAGDDGRGKKDGLRVREGKRGELSTYDEAVVGLLLKGLRLRGWEGRREVN